MDNKKLSIIYSFYNFLNKDVNELNKIILSFFCICFLFLAGFISYNISNGSYAIFNNSTTGKKTMLLKVEDPSKYGIFINNVKYISDVNANKDLSIISDFSDTLLDSTVVLSKSDNNSSMTYQIEIYNSTDYAYYFDKVEYSLGNLIYDNANIDFTINGLEKDYILYSKKSVTFTITFYYKNNVVSSNNTLISLLNFKFVEKSIWNLGGVSGSYSASLTNTTMENYKNLTVNNFFFEPLEIDLPEDIVGTTTFTKTYDPSTGKFSISRTSLQGAGLVTFSGNLYASAHETKLLTSVSGGYQVIIDCTSLSDWQSLTVDDFLIDLKKVEIPFEATGTMAFTKSYDNSTGNLTINRSRIKGEGVIQFTIDVFYVSN